MQWARPVSLILPCPVWPGHTYLLGCSNCFGGTRHNQVLSPKWTILVPWEVEILQTRLAPNSQPIMLLPRGAEAQRGRDTADTPLYCAGALEVLEAQLLLGGDGLHSIISLSSSQSRGPLVKPSPEQSNFFGSKNDTYNFPIDF